MKKPFKVVLMALAMLFVVAGCSDQYADSEFVGLWHAKTAEQSDISVNVEDVYGKMTLELSADGKATIITGERSTDSTWHPEKNSVVIEVQETELVLKKVKGNLLAGDIGGITFSFEKNEEE